MQGHYFDIETYSIDDKPDPQRDKIITIQFQKIPGYLQKNLS